MTRSTPLIAHIVHRFDVGGLENGVVNLINRIPPDRYRHAIIAMTDYTDFSKRLTNPNVTLHALHKKEGKDLGVLIRLWRLLRELRPDIVHTRNLSTVEAAVIAAMAGVPARVHGEHGRDVHDIDGRNKKYLVLRRLCQPFIQRYIPLSLDLKNWLLDVVGVSAAKIKHIYNGVDQKRFSAASSKYRGVLPASFAEVAMVIGTVGRLEEVKDQQTLVQAFAALIKKTGKRDALRLVIIGDGALRTRIEKLITGLGLDDCVWLAGSRDDVNELMRGLDVFVLPSKAEGISNTILEAMASGLPVVATDVGGNAELVVEGQTGYLVPVSNPIAMADALYHYMEKPELVAEHGQQGRKRVESEFSMAAMVSRYLTVYDELCQA